jgi:hypothetical protein
MNRFFALLSLLPALALANPGTETLLKTDTSFPAQGGPAVKFAYINGGNALIMGGGGSLLLGETTGLGAGVYSLASDVTSTDASGLKRDISFTYGGLILDNFFVPHKVMFLNLSTLAGWGSATGSQRVASGAKDITSFFIVEPEFNVMLNVTRELRMGFGLSYRLLAGTDTSAVLGTRLDGFSGCINMMYGK